MTKYEVLVHRTLFVSLEFKTHTKEKAEKLARKQINADFQPILLWKDYDPPDIEYDVMAPKAFNEPK
jgi:hypothetical protein